LSYPSLSSAAASVAALLFASFGSAPCAPAQHVAVTDDIGRTVSYAEAPARIVSLVPAVTEIIYALQEGRRLAGRSVWDDYPPEVTTVPSVGDALRADAERVLAVNPDLVILYAGPDNARSVDQFRTLGVSTLAIRIDDLDDLHRNIMRLGTLLRRDSAAAALWASIDGELAEVRRSADGRPRPRVYYDVAWPPAITVGRGSYLDTLISIAGGENIFHDLAAPSPQVALEVIAARAPDLVLVPSGAGRPAADPARRPGWQAVGAVRRGAIREVDAGLLHRLGPRVGRAARALAAVLQRGAPP
jgi:iron complex transport system substrate-binding protein